MRVPVKSLLLSLILLFAVTGTNAGAAEIGSIIHDSIEMNVTSAVAVWNEEKRQLSIVLLPFEPTEDEIELIRKGRESRIEHELVDPSRWPGWNPRGSISVSWYDPETIGDFGQSMVLIYAFGIGAQNANMNLNYLMAFVEDEITGSLTGDLKPGSTIHLTTSGSDVLSESAMSWELDVETIVHAALPRD